MTKIHLKSIGMLVGLIFGAGFFALPYAVAKAGIFWGTFYFVLTLLMMIFLHLWYGEVTYNFSGKNRFTAYAEILLGNRAKWLAFFVTIFSYYSTLLVYGLLGGIFLSNIFSWPAVIFSFLIFIAGSVLVLFRLEKIASINFYLVTLLLGLIVFLFIAALPNIKIENFSFLNFKFISFSDWFLPYGIWLFSLAGFAALSEVREIIGDLSLKTFKRIIIISLFLAAISYLLFIFTVIGLSGGNTTKDALAGIAGILPRTAILAAYVLGFLAIFTSFIALAADLKNIFQYDFHFSKSLAWLGIFIPPVVLFILGFTNFVGILGIAGSVGLGFTGIFIILMNRRLREKSGDKKFSYLSWILGILIAAGIVAAVISEI